METLIAHSTTEPILSTDTCTVISGTWQDPYTGTITIDPGKLDVDHIVPLKNAWLSGAAEWTRAERKAFANDPANLLAVYFNENRKKGSKAPHEYLPPNTAYQCTYVEQWLTVKQKYNLTLTATEAVFITRFLYAC